MYKQKNNEKRKVQVRKGEKAKRKKKTKEENRKNVF